MSNQVTVTIPVPLVLTTISLPLDGKGSARILMERRRILLDEVNWIENLLERKPTTSQIRKMYNEFISEQA